MDEVANTLTPIEDIDESEILKALASLAIYADEFEARLGYDDEL